MLIHHHHVLPLTAVLFGMLTIGAGCQNKKGALTLNLVPAQEIFRADDPIVVNAIFRSNDGTVCIDKPVGNLFDGELRALDSDSSFHPADVAYCGMPGLLLAPAIPFAYLYSLLDGADTAGRYQLIRQGKPVTYPFLIHPDKRLFRLTRVGDPDSSADKNTSQLAPGHYRLHLKFQSDPNRAYPPPLYWSVYADPIKASAEFTVRNN